VRRIVFVILLLGLTTFACGEEAAFSSTTFTTEELVRLQHSVFENSETAFGFFPTPPEISIKSIVKTVQGIGGHADVLLLQDEIPWEDFIERSDVKSSVIDDRRGMVNLAAQNGLAPVFVIDPLNGLDRREFQNLPRRLTKGNFGTPEIRSAYKNYAIRMAREFQPQYLGLASEINTYMATYPEDTENYLSLYRETYEAIKAESPDTQVFVTFQWDQLTNPALINGGGKTDTASSSNIQWQYIDAFEPQLDLLVISSYPCFFFGSGADIPEDYYTPLLVHTEKPLAIGEGGSSTTDIGQLHGSVQNQIDYLKALDAQLGERLAFWIYLLYSDIKMESFVPVMEQAGKGDDIETLSYFVNMGLMDTEGNPKLSLATWDEIRAKR